MGYTVRFILGTGLVLLCLWSIEGSRPIRQTSYGEIKPAKLQKVEEERATFVGVENLNAESKPKTDFSTEDNTTLDKQPSTISKLQKSDTYKKASNQPNVRNIREEIARSIDINKYISKDFHNKNNVYTLPVSPETDRYVDHEYMYRSTTEYDHDHDDQDHHETHENHEGEFNFELTTPKSALFDHKFKEAVESVEQKLEHIDSHELSSEFESSKENLDLEKLYDETKRNDTKANLNYISYKNIISNATNGKKAAHKDLVVEAGTNVDFHAFYNDTTIIHEDDDGNNTIVKEPKKQEKPHTSTASNIIPDQERSESSTKSSILTTRKNLVLTKPPSHRNSSHISILSNNIETETVKAINPAPYTTPRPRNLEASSSDNVHIVRPVQFTSLTPKPVEKERKTVEIVHAIYSTTEKPKEENTRTGPSITTKEGSIIFTDYAQVSTQPTVPTFSNRIKKKKEPIMFQENQVVPVHVKAPFTSTTEEPELMMTTTETHVDPYLNRITKEWRHIMVTTAETYVEAPLSVTKEKPKLMMTTTETYVEALSSSIREEQEPMITTTETHTEAPSSSTTEKPKQVVTTTETHTEAPSRTTENPKPVITTTERHMEAPFNSTTEKPEPVVTTTERHVEAPSSSTTEEPKPMEITTHTHVEALLNSTTEGPKPMVTTTETHVEASSSSTTEEPKPMITTTETHMGAPSSSTTEKPKLVVTTTETRVEAASSSTMEVPEEAVPTTETRIEAYSSNTTEEPKQVVTTTQRHVEVPLNSTMKVPTITTTEVTTTSEVVITTVAATTPETVVTTDSVIEKVSFVGTTEKLLATTTEQPATTVLPTSITTTEEVVETTTQVDVSTQTDSVPILEIMSSPSHQAVTIESTTIEFSTNPNLLSTTLKHDVGTSTEEVLTITLSSIKSSEKESTESNIVVSNTNSSVTTDKSMRTSKGLVFRETVPTTVAVSTTAEIPATTNTSEFVTQAVITEVPTTEIIKIDEVATTLPLETKSQPITITTVPNFIVAENRTYLVPEIKRQELNETETEATTENNTVSSEADELNPMPSSDNSGTIAAIIISSIGALCLILLAGLLIIMKKRQKHFNYGQRCTPVSLNDYTLDKSLVSNPFRDSKRSHGNPAFEDPVSPSHPLNFPALGKFANNLEDIQAEFQDIPQITARTNELPEGCDVKNRYANVIPLPETRVYLTPIDGYPNSDYINANYVTGPKNIKQYYIACQAPMQSTVDDFWRMVWEQQTKVILMLTHLFENGVEKCFDYLPPSEVLDCHRAFGDFLVTLKKREVKDKYIISILQLKNMVSSSWREVTHFWYLGWPEKGVPSEASSLIAFLIEARSYMKSSSMDRKDINGSLTNGSTAKNEVNPVVVHCSPGTGRTGVVIACDIAIREYEQTRLVDVPRIVSKIRRERASSVQTKEQYAFIYKVVNFYATKLTGGAFDTL